MTTVVEAQPLDIPEVRAMLHEYAAWVAVDLCFQGFTKEVQDLPGAYGPPGGALFIAHVDGRPSGMIAFRRLDAERAEMKRLFVRPATRGAGVGRLLVERAIFAARARGYRAMVLDTLPAMQSAQRMYEQFGFRDVPAYYPSEIPGTRYMSLEL